MLRQKSGGLLGDDSSFTTTAVPIHDESKDLTTGVGAAVEALAGFRGSKEQKPEDDCMSEASSDVARMVKPEPEDDTRSLSTNKAFKAAFKEISSKVHDFDRTKTRLVSDMKPRRKLEAKPKPKPAKAKHKLDDATKREGKGMSLLKIKSRGRRSGGANKRRPTED